MKILIAEDDLLSSKFLTGTLQKLEHEVICAPNGREALAQFHVHRPAIVISDWMMPEMDGLQLCQSIRAQPLDQYTFFILQTARNSREDYRVAMDAGVDDFLGKPVNREELVTRVRVADRMIRQRNEAEKQIRLLARFPSDNPNPVLQVNRESRILYANLASLGLLTQWQTGLGEAAPDKLRQLVDLLYRTGDRQEVEVTCADRVFLFSATSVSEDGVTYLYGHDITERKQAENELVILKNLAEEHALHDQLTGLPNRRLLTERLNVETARALRQQSRLALVVLDIDNFKQINDGYGHKLGDQVIVCVSNCLRENLRDTDTVCRWGGDELVLLLTDLRERGDVGRVCQKLTAAVKAKTAESGITAPVSLSLGSAVFPDDAQDPTLLLQQADHALYQAKADGRDCWREFKGFPNGHDAKGNADLFIRLSAAVSEGRISTFYQPIVDAETHKVVGAETLARWQDGHYGWVPPDVFIPLAEDKGLIFQLGHLVLVQALDQLRDWHQRGLDLTVSVNLSKRQILDSDFRNRLLELVRERNLKPESIILEVTERQSVLGHALGQSRLEDLARNGFKLSIDDFGSGYSSFDLVGDTSFSELKIHMGLVRGTNTPRGRRIVQAIVEMGRTLGLRMVAEGIEDQVTQAMLTALGVHKLQGYLFSRPLQPGAFVTFAEKHIARRQNAA
ncbi:MAG TPA: EAL domain-containing protein [Candidatus Saccharimonadales bacterium]|nr:EAL domain-containing protein [Candidatus Saccharimonadales bacterium]